MNADMFRLCIVYLVGGYIAGKLLAFTYDVLREKYKEKKSIKFEERIMRGRHENKD